MAKRILSTVLDQALNYIKTNCNKVTLCSAEPTTFAEGNTTFMLANAAYAGAGADFTLAAGDVSGRKVTDTAKNGVAVTNAGTSTHKAWLNTTGSELLAATTHTSTALAAGGTVDIGAHKFEINNPT